LRSLRLSSYFSCLPLILSVISVFQFTDLYYNLSIMMSSSFEAIFNCLLWLLNCSFLNGPPLCLLHFHWLYIFAEILYFSSTASMLISTSRSIFVMRTLKSDYVSISVTSMLALVNCLLHFLIFLVKDCCK
jgi:hypothetical protein